MSSAKAAFASRRALATASSRPPASRTMRIPRPPPPADALTSTGKPSADAAFARAAAPFTSTPGSTGTPAFCMSALAASFAPMAVIASGGGPMKTRPDAATRRAKSAFSDRKP